MEYHINGTAGAGFNGSAFPPKKDRAPCGPQPPYSAGAANIRDPMSPAPRSLTRLSQGERDELKRTARIKELGAKEVVSAWLLAIIVLTAMSLVLTVG